MQNFWDMQFQEIAAEKIFKKTFILVFRAVIRNSKNKHKTTKKIEIKQMTVNALLICLLSFFHVFSLKEILFKR